MRPSPTVGHGMCASRKGAAVACSRLGDRRDGVQAPAQSGASVPILCPTAWQARVPLTLFNRCVRFPGNVVALTAKIITGNLLRILFIKEIKLHL